MHAGNTPSKPTKQEIQVVVASPKKEGEDPDNNHSGPSITNVYIQPQISPPITVNTSSNAASKAESESNSQSAAYAFLSNKLNNVMQSIQSITTENVSHGLQKCFGTYKWHIFVIAPTTTYLTLCIFLIHVERIMNNPTNWTQWKHHLSIEELNSYCLDDKEKNQFTQDLIKDILKRHLNTTQPTNHISPLVGFILAIDRESALVTHYIRIAQLLKLSKTINIFPTNAEKLEKAKECKQRLELVKKLFLGWTATHNLEQFLRSIPTASPQPPSSTTPTA
jgi:hypothetical protein